MENQYQLEEENIFDVANRYIRGTEGSLVNFLSAIAPWGAPLPTAYMSYQHMIEFLKFDWWIAFPSACVIEILGFSTVSTAISFWSHNQRTKDDKGQAPLWVALLAFGFYLALVLAINVIIDACKGSTYETTAIIVVRALFTLMTIPAALVMSVRTQHHELVKALTIQRRLADEQAERERILSDQAADRVRILEDQRLKDQLEHEHQLRLEAREERAAIRRDRIEAKRVRIQTEQVGPQPTTKVSENFGKFPKTWPRFTHLHKHALAEALQHLQKEDISLAAGVTVRSVENWISYLIDEGYLTQEGQSTGK